MAEYRKNFATLTPRSDYESPATVPMEPMERPQEQPPLVDYDTAGMYGGLPPQPPTPPPVIALRDFIDLHYGVACFKGLTFPLPKEDTEAITKLLKKAAVRFLRTEEPKQ